jgi:hypothetical protein
VLVLRRITTLELVRNRIWAVTGGNNSVSPAGYKQWNVVAAETALTPLSKQLRRQQRLQPD